MLLPVPSPEPRRGAPIGELLTLLSRYAPEVREQFKPNFPSEGMTLGGSESGLRMRSELAESGLKEAVRLARKWHPRMHRRAAGSQTLQFVAHLLTFLGGATVLTPLAEQYPLLRYVLGGLTLLGSVVALIARHVGQVLWGEVRRSPSERCLSLRRVSPRWPRGWPCWLGWILACCASCWRTQTQI